MEQLLEYNDVLIKPKPSKVNSREEVNTKTILRTVLNSFIELDVPIIASPMKGIVGTELIKKLGELGGIGILHRFHTNKNGKPDVKKRAEELLELDESGVPYGLAIGLHGLDETLILDLVLEEAVSPKILCIDVANGYTEELIEASRAIFIELRKRQLPIALMAGNVVDVAGVRALSNAGVSLYRIGIGSGQLCTTRNKTGIGYPQLSAIMKIREDNWMGLIADGGIKTSGDAVKALAGGADAVMMGSMFAKTFESENTGVIYGMASKQLQEQFYGTLKSVEGISKEIKKEISLKDLVEDITWSIKSACTYVDAYSLAGLRRNAEFIKVSPYSIEENKL